MLLEVKNGYVKTEHHNGITTIEFFHPQGNSLPGQILDELAKEIHAAGIGMDTRVIILRSGGDRAFCAGASFEELSLITDKAAGQRFFTGFAHVINSMRKCPKLIIARIQGKCVGGGVGLAAAADYAIALEGADIKLTELSIGLGPFVVGPVIQRKIGLSSFSQLSVDSTMWRNADWARRKGLYAELHPEKAGMDESISRLSNLLAHSNCHAMLEMKKIFWEGTEHWDELLLERAAISGELVLSEHSKTAIEKFKRKSTG